MKTKEEEEEEKKKRFSRITLYIKKNKSITQRQPFFYSSIDRRNIHIQRTRKRSISDTCLMISFNFLS
jgi:hypothetical protein